LGDPGIDWKIVLNCGFIVWTSSILFRIRTSNVPSGFTRGMKLV